MRHRPIRSFALILLALLVTGSSALAQEKPAVGNFGSIITAAASGDRVRITAPSSIAQMHLEVYALSGEKLFDNEIRGGNVFDWLLQDGQAQRLTAGDYVCVVTVKNIAGRITQKIGSVKVAEKDVSVGPAELAQLSPQQSQAIGPMEENSSWTVLDGKKNQTTTVIAHDGTDGQIVRGRGAFSFRIGDFFSGNDQEQMRLTEEGNLGIGTSKPKAKLDVAGAVRARQGFVFNDGSTLKVNDKGLLTLTDSNGNVVPDVSGSGTTGRLTKWTDGPSGALGDSVAIDTGTGLQLTAAPSGAVDTNLLYLNNTNGTTGVLAGNVPSFGAANGPFFAMRGNTYTTIPNQRGLFTIAAGNVPSPAGDDGSVKFNTGNDQLRMVIRPAGNVGIGNNNPQSLLDVNGNINTSTQYNIGGNRVLGISGFSNTFAGVDAGTLTATDISGNSFFGKSAGAANEAGVENSFFGVLAGRESTGSLNAFFGASAGQHNTSGNSNTFIGADTGLNNTTENANTFIGSHSNGGAGITNATAIGADALVTQSNSLVLGNGVKVGIGTTAPSQALAIQTAGSTFIDVRANGGTQQIQVGADAGGGILSTISNHDLILRAGGNVDRLRIRANGNVGIGTTVPNAKLHIVGGNIFIAQPNSLVITSPNGNCWFITVSDAGVLSTIPVTCP